MAKSSGFVSDDFLIDSGRKGDRADIGGVSGRRSFDKTANFRRSLLFVGGDGQVLDVLSDGVSQYGSARKSPFFGKSLTALLDGDLTS